MTDHTENEWDAEISDPFTMDHENHEEEVTEVPERPAKESEGPQVIETFAESDEDSSQKTPPDHPWGDPYGNQTARDLGRDGRRLGSTFRDGSGRNYVPQERPKMDKGKAFIAIALVVALLGGSLAGSFLGIRQITRSQMTQNDITAIGLTRGSESAEEPAAQSAESSTAAATTQAVQLQTAENSGAGILTSEGIIESARLTDVADIVEDVMPSIVSVYNNYTYQARDWFGQIYQMDETSAGSGIIVAQTDEELLVVTNNHVVEGNNTLEVKFINDDTAEAVVKGTDADNDLAIISIPLSGIESDTLSALKVAVVGDSEALRVGEPAIAIGNALGYGQSVTVGVISAVREFQVDQQSDETLSYIQTDAAINPGNSGGALLNAKGEVIGINVSKIGATKVEGMCFAIPMSRAEPVLLELMNQKTVVPLPEGQQGYLGIRGISVTGQISQAYDMPIGVYVAEAIQGTGAESGGIYKGDIITAVDGNEMKDMDQLRAYLASREAGSTVQVTLQRFERGEYREYVLPIVLSVRPAEDEAESEAPQDEQDDSQNQERDLDPFGFFR